MYDDISIVGITEMNHYPVCKCKKYFKQAMEEELLWIPSKKPNIESIDEINVNMCLKDLKIIKTVLGPKIIIHGCKKIKIMYTACNAEQSVHSAHWNIPFYNYILFNNVCYDKCKSCLKDIFIGIEDIFVKEVKPECFSICILYILCPNIKSIPSCNTSTNKKIVL